MTTIIFDQDGRVLMTQSGDMGATDVNVIVSDVPDGYIVTKVNTETMEPVLEEAPKSNAEKRLEELEAQIAALIGTEE